MFNNICVKNSKIFKGEKTIFKFDLACLNCFQRKSLQRILDTIQLENVGEIEIDVDRVVCVDLSCDSFLRYSVKVDFGELFVCWDFERSVFTITSKEDAPCVLRENLRRYRPGRPGDRRGNGAREQSRPGRARSPG